jgi:Homeodomain-like domain
MCDAGSMAQIVYPLVSAADRARLEAIIGDRNRAQKHVARARIILASADRPPVSEVAKRADVGRPAVWRWQRRFALQEDPAGTAPQAKDSTANAVHGTYDIAGATVEDNTLWGGRCILFDNGPLLLVADTPRSRTPIGSPSKHG